MLWLWVMIGGALGSGLRYVLSGLVAHRLGETFPWGTLTVNVLGSFLIGLLFVLSGPDSRWLVAPAVRQFLLTGVLGGFTTFSAFSLQTVALLQAGSWAAATANILLSLGACLLACFLGLALGSAFIR